MERGRVAAFLTACSDRLAAFGNLASVLDSNSLGGSIVTRPIRASCNGLRSYNALLRHHTMHNTHELLAPHLTLKNKSTWNCLSHAGKHTDLQSCTKSQTTSLTLTDTNTYMQHTHSAQETPTAWNFTGTRLTQTLTSTHSFHEPYASGTGYLKI